VKYLMSVILCGCCSLLYGVHVDKGGTLSMLRPFVLEGITIFLPYNPVVVIAGDKIANYSANISRWSECSNIFSFSTERKDFEMLNDFKKSYPNIHPYYGLLHSVSDDKSPYFPTLPHERFFEDSYGFPGSLLPPIDFSLPFLFGEESKLLTYSLSEFCERNELTRVHFLYLNCGGTELKVLQSAPHIVEDSIAVFIKTYHKPIREGLSSFEEINQFMLDRGFELMTHYIYDKQIGDALYIKQKYLSAVYRRKEL